MQTSKCQKKWRKTDNQPNDKRPTLKYHFMKMIKFPKKKQMMEMNKPGLIGRPGDWYMRLLLFPVIEASFTVFAVVIKFGDNDNLFDKLFSDNINGKSMTEDGDDGV